ncbi:MAG: RNA polymerase sigma factor [Candidatus Aminicenantaceae bacterium]
MYFSVIATTQKELIRVNCGLYVTISQKEEISTMSQEEKLREKEVGLRCSPFLRDLLKRGREGDTIAMEGIYQLYKQSIFNLVYRYTHNFAVAEDLLQDIFITVFTHLKDLQRDETFVSWLYRVAINTCYSYLRSRKNRLQKTIPLEEVEGKIEEKTSSSLDVMIKKPLDDAIQILPHKLKNIFLLHDVQGFKHEEIAEILGCSVGTSKSQLFKARIKLREHLEKKQLI